MRSDEAPIFLKPVILLHSDDLGEAAVSGGEKRHLIPCPGLEPGEPG